MKSQKIEVFEGNTLTVTCTVRGGLADLTDYVATLIVVDKHDTEMFTVDGSIDALVITFNVTNVDNQIVAGDYKYEIVIESSANSFTLVQDIYKVKKSVLFAPPS